MGDRRRSRRIYRFRGGPAPPPRRSGRCRVKASAAAGNRRHGSHKRLRAHAVRHPSARAAVDLRGTRRARGCARPAQDRHPRPAYVDAGSPCVQLLDPRPPPAHTVPPLNLRPCRCVREGLLARAHWRTCRKRRAARRDRGLRGHDEPRGAPARHGPVGRRGPPGLHGSPRGNAEVPLALDAPRRGQWRTPDLDRQVPKSGRVRGVRRARARRRPPPERARGPERVGGDRPRELQPDLRPRTA